METISITLADILNDDHWVRRSFRKLKEEIRQQTADEAQMVIQLEKTIITSFRNKSKNETMITSFRKGKASMRKRKLDETISKECQWLRCRDEGFEESPRIEDDEGEDKNVARQEADSSESQQVGLFTRKRCAEEGKSKEKQNRKPRRPKTSEAGESTEPQAGLLTGMEKGKSKTKKNGKARRPKAKEHPDLAELKRNPPDIPEEFKERIQHLGGVDLTLAITKQIYCTDVNPHHCRFLIGNAFESFIRDDEKKTLDKRGRIPVRLIEPSLGDSILQLIKWKMSSSTYALVKGWTNVVSSNGLEESDVVQLWYFRVETSICMALVKLRSGRHL